MNTTLEKKKVMLSLPVETNTKLEELAKRFGMTKSGLVNFLINQTEEIGTIYKKKIQSGQALDLSSL